MAVNPFHYGTPASGDFFTGREQELAALTSRVRNGINVVVTAPRRYGKTSLLERACAELTRSRAAIVRINVLQCPDLATLAAKLASETYSLPGGTWRRARHAVPEFLRRFRVTPIITFDEGGHPTFLFSPGLSGPRADELVADVYAILSSLSAKRPAALVLDEFQAVPELGPHLPSLLKALADEHPQVSLVLAGSRRHLMEELVLNAGAPLYNMAERIALGPIDPPTMEAFLVARADSAGKPMSRSAAGELVALAGPVPHDIQRLAYETFDAAGRRINSDDVVAGLERIVMHEASAYSDRFSRLGIGQRRVLQALAERSPLEQPYTAEFARRVGYAGPPGVRRAVIALEDDELVESRANGLVVADPFFAWWLRGLRSGVAPVED